jgi:ABC-type phosphate/phosphonate transport system permease subunit
MVATASDADRNDRARPAWSRFRYPDSLIRLSALLGVLVFLVYSIQFLNIDLWRLLGAFPRLAEILATRYYPPDLGYVMDGGFLLSVLQTIQMSILGGAFGAAAQRQVGARWRACQVRPDDLHDPLGVRSE